jgi:hypothetical protein
MRKNIQDFGEIIKMYLINKIHFNNFLMIMKEF